MLINDVQVYLVILRPLTIFYFPVFFKKWVVAIIPLSVNGISKQLHFLYLTFFTVLLAMYIPLLI